MSRLSERINDLHASPIREILSVINRPGMISFAGGLPAEETFFKPGLSDLPAGYLQYGASEGEPELRSAVSEDLHKIGLSCHPGQVIILTGSQQGIDLAAKLLVDSGTLIAAENPTYLAALQVLRFYGARFCTLDVSQAECGVSAANLPNACYTVPSFSNPTGRCQNLDERKALAASCEKYDMVLIEDDPYRELSYGPFSEDAPCTQVPAPICSHMQQGSWLYLGSFSKTFAPGLRLGFVVCSEDLIVPLTRLKQAADLHSNRVSQYWILQQLAMKARDERMHSVRQFYKRRRDSFEQALQDTFSELASWARPDGGLFFWLKLRDDVDTSLLLPRAINAGVAFMPGAPFFHSSPQSAYLRLNFSHAAEVDQRRGLEVLAQLVKQARDKNTY